jgi:hypothetical protein
VAAAGKLTTHVLDTARGVPAEGVPLTLEVRVDGGRVKRLHQTLAHSPALAALVAASDRGAVIAGYSAGSQALGVGARHGPPVAPSPVHLLGWLANLVIVAHCSGLAMLEELRATMRAFPGTRGLGIAHAGAVLLPSGWQRIENVVTGFDDGSVVLDHPDAHPHLLCHTPYPLETDRSGEQR